MSDSATFADDGEFLQWTRSKDGRVDLGASNSLETLPRRIQIDGLLWLVAASPTIPTGVHLLSDGRDPVAVVDHEGRLLADVPSAQFETDAVARSPRAARLDGLTIALHAHACLQFEYRGFSLLTDPWLVGPAFFGAWTQYPPPLIDAASLEPNAIWISNEHSDHFHETTLARLNRDTPVYFPDFPNRRIVNRLRDLGFSRAQAVSFGVPVTLNDHIRVTCHEPGNVWNDALVLIEIDGFRFLNVNDAGVNRRIARALAPVDVIASSFSPGAQGYPQTWTHLSEQRKREIGARACEEQLRILSEAVDLYGAVAVLPFASHFSLWHPSHERFVNALPRNTLGDVVHAFAGSPTTVIDLAPGDVWNGADGEVIRSPIQTERCATGERQIEYARERFDPSVFAAHHPLGGAPARLAVERYFLRLNQTPDIAFCENLIVSVLPTNDDRSLQGGRVDFEIAGGRLTILETSAKRSNLTIEIPAGVLGAIVHDNVSWDEAYMGYWCRFSRQPDVHHVGFWRLLQSPYFAKPAVLPKPRPGDMITEHRIIASILERLGMPAERIIRRHGLYCIGCRHSTAETLGDAAEAHGLDDGQLTRLVRELNDLAAARNWNGRT